MLSVKRREKIMEILREKEQVTTQFLKEKFDVTGATIRNDLKTMEKEGLLKRIHGGAIISENLVIPKNYINLHTRSKKNSEEKKAIARGASKYIEEEKTLLLDASSTVLYLIPYLSYSKKVKVITNGLFTALTVKQYCENLNTILIGGFVRKNSGAIESLLGEDIISQINGDIMFTSAHGFNLEKGLTDFNLNEVQLKKKMVAKCDKLIALVDHTKIGFTSTTSFAALEQIDVLVTDSKTSEEKVQEIRNAGIRVVVNNINNN